MSTKTLRKRIAFVAVAGLTAGLMTAVTVPTANATIASIAASSTTGQTGMCLAGSLTAASPRYFAVGGTQTLVMNDVASYASQTATISGPAKFTSATASGTISGDFKSAAALTGAAGTLTMLFTGTGAVSVTVDENPVVTLYFLVTAGCGSGVDASKSFAQLNTSSSTAPTSSIDVSAATKVNYTSAGQKVYLNMDLNDAWGGVAAGLSSSMIATVTGGCTVNFTETASSGTTTAISTGTASANDSLAVFGDNTPRTCVVTVTLDGAVVATKTVRFYGDVATLTVDTASSSAIWAYGVDGTASATAVGADAIVYVAKDSAGNVINPSAAPTYVGLTGGFSQVTVADGGYSYALSTTNGAGSLDVNATSVSVRGAGTYKLKLTRASDGVAVYSADISASINKGVYTYTAGWDKASYVQGDIMTLTITAKDSAGNPVYDGATIGTHSIAVGGVTTFVTTAAADSFFNGVKKYKYSAGDNASGYGWTVDITNGSLQDAVTGTVNITAPTGGVSNADVLKAIVSLIASINKQIAALQKALLKK
jgi:hypothetical protein